MTSSNKSANADPAELAKFSALAHRWWDPTSEFKPLHDINPLRLELHRARMRRARRQARARRRLRRRHPHRGDGERGAQVTGIDLSEKALAVARLHQLESGTAVEYRRDRRRGARRRERPAAFDVVTCMELLEHVPDPASTIAACATLVRAGGSVVFSTINRNPKAYAFAILGAEYVLNLLPRGTHDYARFLKPAEIAAWAGAAGLDADAMIGMTYNPLTRVYRLEPDTSVNYIATFRRDG